MNQKEPVTVKVHRSKNFIIDLLRLSNLPIDEKVIKVVAAIVKDAKVRDIGRDCLYKFFADARSSIKHPNQLFTLWSKWRISHGKQIKRYKRNL